MGRIDDEGFATKVLCRYRRSLYQGMVGPHCDDPRPRRDAIDRELPLLRILEAVSVADIQVSRQDSFHLAQRGKFGDLDIDLRISELERAEVRSEFSAEGGVAHKADPHRSNFAARRALRYILCPRGLLDGSFCFYAEEGAGLSE